MSLLSSIPIIPPPGISPSWPPGDVGYPPNLIPHPAGFDAPPYAELAFFFIAGAAVVLLALPWALRSAWGRNYIPLLVMGSALLCSLEEPMLDMLGHLHWADNLTFLYANFGVPIPALIPPCYVAFLGLQAYFCYFVLRRGAQARHFYMLLAMGLILDAIMETIGINLGVYEYYGFQPFEFLNFPYWWGFINGASFVTVGFLLWYFVPLLKGWHQLGVLLIAPAGMMSTYFVVGWVHIVAHNSGLPEWVRLIAAAIMMAECVLLMKVLAHFAARPETEAVPNWTLPRMFLYTVTPSAGGREKLMAKMEAEGEERAARKRAELVETPQETVS